MQRIDFDTNPMKADKEDLSVQSSQDAAVKGARILTCSTKRLGGFFRLPEQLAAMIYAIIGSRTNTSSHLQDLVTSWFALILKGFVSIPCIQTCKACVECMQRRLCA